MEPDPVLTDPRYVALAAENAALRAEMAGLREVIERLEKLLETLQGKLSKDSHNSHKPPGSDGPQAPPRPSNPPTGRKRGGQPGRKGKAREPLAEGSENRTVEVKLTACPHCAFVLPPEAITGTVTHRVLDLVRKLTEVVAFRLDKGCCPNCHKDIQAKLPPESGTGELGPQIRALVAYLRTQGRMSLGPLKFFCKEVLHVDVSRGWLHESGIRISDALAPVWEALGEEIRNSDVVNMDETGFGRKDRDWIWVALTTRTVFFHFSTTRGFEALKAILPEDFAGVLCTDRYTTYRKLKEAIRQYCWAHLRREIIALSEAKDATVSHLGKQMLEEQERIFDLWHLFKNQEIDRPALRRHSAIILARMKRQLGLAAKTEHKAARNLGKSLLEHWDKLWTFLRMEDVEPTNNSAERALRPLVILKRIFQRLPSKDGKTFFERLLTTGATARIRGVPYFDWLISALHAAHQELPIPALETG